MPPIYHHPQSVTAMSATIPIAAGQTHPHVNLSTTLLKTDIIHERSHQVNASAMRELDVLDSRRIRQLGMIKPGPFVFNDD